MSGVCACHMSGVCACIWAVCVCVCSLLESVPWEVRIVLSYPSGREIDVPTDTSYYYDVHPQHRCA